VFVDDTGDHGAGLMQNLVSPEAWRRVATRALEIVHVDPATGKDVEGACDRCCYDCLYSYYNQHHHPHLDRTTIVEVLQQLAEADSMEPTTAEAGIDWDAALKSAVGSEPDVVRRLRELKFPPPLEQHAVVRDGDGVPVTEADLLYPDRLIVWIHGSVHHLEHVAKHDEETERRVKALGYRIVTIWPERLEEGMRDLALRLGREDLVP
jgi:hypothetical protein